MAAAYMNKHFIKAFTLIEILISLFIITIIMSLLTLVIKQSIYSNEVISQKNTLIEKRHKLLTVIEQDFFQTLAITLPDIKNIPQGQFYSRNNFLHYCKNGLTNPGFSLNQSTVQCIDLVFEHSTLSRLSKILSDNNNANLYTQILAEDINDLKWFYYDIKYNEFNIWPPTQTMSNQIPSIVKLWISFKDNTKIERLFLLPNREYNIGIP